MDTSTDREYTGSEIAIIGMACRFPGASTVEAFWQNLRDGVESIAQLSDDDLRSAGVSPQEWRDPSYVRAAPILDDIESFDAGFFGYSAVEAEILDPQQRLLFECAWEALEHAGYTPESYRQRIGAYVGSKTNTYLFHLAANRDLMRSFDFIQLVLGGDQAMLSTRISYKLDLKGPSYAVQTACSTSLVAVHLACQSLLIDECRMALAGAVALNVPHKAGYQYRPGDILSPDGHCRPFDADAQGTLFGSGAGMVVLKRLEDALADGDTIHAIIRGSATNNDGAVKATFTAPSIDGQAEVITEALGYAGVTADTISYVEAHGTGTALGDPIEVAALTRAFRATTERNGFCAIGSVKSNLGHLDAAAGMSSLIKTVLALKHGQIPPSLHYRQPNPRIDFENSPFVVNTTLRPWASDGPRRAGVSSFGFGGTNAHLILEEAPPRSPSAPGTPWQLLVLSARSPAALEQQTARLAAHLAQQPQQQLADVAFTLQVGRKAFPHRRVLVCADRADALAALQANDPQQLISGQATSHNRPVVFLFPGQGAQYPGMARDLYASEPVFRAALDECASLLRPHLDIALGELLFADTPAVGERLQQTQYAQPALFAVEYALAQLWQHWGVQPQALAGHSLGEYVAATLAGVFSLADALALVAARGQLMQQQPPGAMLSVPLPEADVLPLLGDQLDLAAVNAPGRCVVSGPAAAIAALEQRLSAQEIMVRRLHTSHAFHSAMLDPVVAAFEARVRAVTLQPPSRPVVSNVTGSWLTAEQATDPRYWANQLRAPVRFADGLALLGQEPARVLLEVGPGTALSSLARQQPVPLTTSATLRHPNDQRHDQAVLLGSLGRLWASGVAIDWTRLHSAAPRQRVPLPTYPFERQRYWIDATTPLAAAPAPTALAKQATIADWLYRPDWQPAPLPAPADAPLRQRSWLLFADASGTAAALAQRLEQAEQRVLTVGIGAQFARVGPQDFLIDPANPSDYDQLIEALQADDAVPQRIVHLWSVTAGEAVAQQLEQAQLHGFHSLLTLAQALQRQRVAASIQITVVSNQLQAAVPGDRIAPEKATILGPCKVIPQEQPNLFCRSIDLPSAPADADLDLLLRELLAPAGDPLVAYRNGTRLVQRFTPIAPTPPVERPAILRERGVYLIFGGLGGLGLTIAQELAERVRARLVLVGRSQLPARQDWASWLASHSDDDSISRRLQAVQAIEALGSEVLLLQADLSNAAAVQAALEQAEQRFGGIHGVVHAAGVARGQAFRSIQETGPREIAEHFGPKVIGLVALAQALRGRQLDFCLLQSSLSSVLGGLGNVAYAAASLFADAFAQAQRAAGGHWLSIDWDSWHRPDEASPGLGTTLVELAITPQEGAAALRQVLACQDDAQVVVSTADLQARIDRWLVSGAPLDDEAPAQQEPLPGRNELARRIAGIWQRVLNVAQVGFDDNFFDLGGDSLSGMQLIGELKRELRVQIAPVTLFEAPTVNALAAYLSPEPTSSPTEQSLVPTLDADARAPIAIIGLHGRFPGADSVEAFWQNLCASQESITFFSNEELAAAGIPPEITDQPSYVKARPTLNNIDLFDAQFFGYTPRDAELMDPQHRLFLECAWEALELAGYPTGGAAGRVGVYAGASISTYLLQLYSDPHFAASLDPLQTIIGNDKDSLTTSVSYKLNLKGPSMAVQTFCSTSLVAVHLACQSLRRNECELALAGGVSIVAPQQSGYHYQEEGIVSPDGHCRPFDAQAQGTLFGNGVGLVVLKRLDQALADGDTVHAVIRGSAINNDGSLKVGYTAPSVDGQAEVIRAALADAAVTGDTISYVEAHGTGTALGDPIEVAALTRAFRATTERNGFCAIGSVKGNVGHLDRAAGIAALIKTVLALQHQQLPPSLHYQAPNPRIDFANSPFVVNTTLRPWASDGPRRAGVSALGFGGTNAHVIVEEAPVVVYPPSARPQQLLVLSARSPAALEQQTARLAAHLAQQPQQQLADVAFTLQVGRKAFPHRRVLVCTDRADALAALSANDPQRLLTGQATSNSPPVVFLFPGQGAQYPGMARDLYASEPVFRAALDECAALLRPHLDIALRELLFADMADAGEQLQQTQYAQPALFAVEYALAQLWLHWGVQPQALLGHSLGEYVAATLAGVFSLADALALVAARGQLMQQQPPGAMLSVPLPEAELLPLLGGQLDLAAVNSPGQCVASGPAAAIAALEQRLAAKGVTGRRLHTSHAFHSAMLDPVVAAFEARLQAVALQPPSRPVISNVTGNWLTAAQATDPRYWANQLRAPVRFADGLALAFKDAEAILLEVGPGRTLSSLARQQPSAGSARVILSSLRHPQDQAHDQAVLLATLGRLWLAGANLDLARITSDERRQRVILPTYPFERQRYWMTGPAAALPGTRRSPGAPGKRSEIADWFYLPVWQRAELPARPVADAAPQTWLILADDQGLGAALAQQLDLAEQTVVLAVPGTHFHQLDQRLYALDPRQRDDYSALLDQLRSQELLPTQVLHLWSVTNGAVAAGIAGFEAAQERGFYSLLFLVQALARQQPTAPIQISVVGNQLQSVTAQEQTNPEKVPILGLCQVIPQEYPGIGTRSIDVALPPRGQRMERLAGLLVQECQGQAASEPVAYRGTQRWVQRFEPLRLEAPAETAAPLRSGGVYLITGGLSEIGLMLSEYLTRALQPRLILVENGEFPAREEWEEWIESYGEQDAISQKIRHALALEQQGAQLLVAGVTSDQPAQLRALIAQAQTQYGALHGVIHAATVVGEQSFRAIQETDPIECGWHFAAKAHGLILLEQALGDLPLDFCLLVSSLSVFLGGRGYAAYAAANHFLDAAAQRHNSSGATPWISVNWDAWQLPGAKMTAMSQDLAQVAMTPEQGGEAFRRAISRRDSDQLVVSTADLVARISQWQQRLETARAPVAGGPRHARPNLPTPYIAPTSELERTIAEIWQNTLGFEQIGLLDNFFELGGDSLIAIRVVAQLKEALGMDISVVSLYERLTIKDLSSWLAAGGDAAQLDNGIEARAAKISRRKQFRQMKRAGR